MKLDFSRSSKAKFCTYVLLDHTKKVHTKINNIEFEYEPFYVGCGMKTRPRSSIREAIKLQPDSEKSERIMNIVTHDIVNDKFTFTNPPIIRIAGFFKTKKEALYLETMLLNIIPKGLLTNSLFPYLTKDKIIEYDSPELFYGYHINKLKMRIFDEMDNGNYAFTTKTMPQYADQLIKNSTMYFKQLHEWDTREALMYCGYDPDIGDMIEEYHELVDENRFLYRENSKVNIYNFKQKSIVNFSILK